MRWMDLCRGWLLRFRRAFFRMVGIPLMFDNATLLFRTNTSGCQTTLELVANNYYGRNGGNDALCSIAAFVTLLQSCLRTRKMSPSKIGWLFQLLQTNEKKNWAHGNCVWCDWETISFVHVFSSVMEMPSGHSVLAFFFDEIIIFFFFLVVANPWRRPNRKKASKKSSKLSSLADNTVLRQ